MALRSGTPHTRAARVAVIRRAGISVACLALVVAGSACERCPATETGSEALSSGSAVRPNVLLVVFDTTRLDDWPFNEVETAGAMTPVLDSLARASQVFTNAHSLYTVTVPSHVTMFTGREVADGSPGAGWDYVSPSLFTILGQHGYRTFAFSGNKNLSTRTIDAMQTVHVSDPDLHLRSSAENLTALLSIYGEHTGDPAQLSDSAARASLLRNRRVMMGDAESVNAAALEAMREFASGGPRLPFFLFLNYNDAHDPYFPLASWRDRFVSRRAGLRFRGNLFDPAQREVELRTADGTVLSGMLLSLTSAGLSAEDIAYARELHRAELAYADHQFGILLRELGRLDLLEHTIIVCVSDHGEAFGEAGRMSHSGAAIPALVDIPLFILLPGLPAAQIGEHVDHRDIKPTILDYLDIEENDSTGRSLLPLIRARGRIPPPAATPRVADDEVGNLIRGQDQEATRRLTES